MSNRSAFVLASAMGSSLIVNRFDHDPVDLGAGVGIELLEKGEHEPGIAMLVMRLAADRKRQCGHGVVILDVGANIGHLTVFWARFMAGASGAPWGGVHAFEPQEWPYYALCGNIAINNCFNAQAHRLVLGDRGGIVEVPRHHPLTPYNFGGCRIGEKGFPTQSIQQATLDELGFRRLDILKLDIEGMEPQAIRGAGITIEKYKPLIIAEIITCGLKELLQSLDGLGYELAVESAANVFLVHKDENNATLQQTISAWKRGTKAA